MNQLVIRRAQQRVTGLWAESGLVDQRLRMFDAHADRERFGFDVDPARMQHLEGVTGAVTDRQDHVFGGQFLARGKSQAAQLPRFDQYIFNPLPETDLAAQGLNAGAHLFDHADQSEGADMRLADVEDLLGRAG